MLEIKKLMENNIPFAVMQYFESFIASKKETNKKYELISINRKGEPIYKVFNNTELVLFKKNKDKFNLVLKNSDGCVYEFQNFTKHREFFYENSQQIQ